MKSSRISFEGFRRIGSTLLAQNANKADDFAVIPGGRLVLDF